MTSQDLVDFENRVTGVLLEVVATIHRLEAEHIRPTGILCDASLWRELREFSLTQAFAASPLHRSLRCPTPDRLTAFGLPVAINHDFPGPPSIHVCVGGRHHG